MPDPQDVARNAQANLIEKPKLEKFNFQGKILDIFLILSGHSINT